MRKFLEKINSVEKFSGELSYDEPMSKHTSFKVGGSADVWVRPDKDIFPDYSARLLSSAREEGIPVFVLGGGANIVVSERGIRGIVLDTGSWNGFEVKEKPDEKDGDVFTVKVLSGTSVDCLTDQLAAKGLSGLEFLAGMPGSVGGAVWMNARCYEKSVSDALIETEILNENREAHNATQFPAHNATKFPALKIAFRAEDFSYKKSPFQGRDALILSARFSLRSGEPEKIMKVMAEHRRDREEKGHYRFPSAGSAFKNNRDFGVPTGKIIDELGLRGLRVGGAQVAPWHGNIVINTGNASGNDIKDLMGEVSRRVKEARGFDLESEVLFVGEWNL